MYVNRVRGERDTGCMDRVYNVQIELVDFPQPDALHTLYQHMTARRTGPNKSAAQTFKPVGTALAPRAVGRLDIDLIRGHRRGCKVQYM